MSKRQVTATIDEELVEEMERIREETGVPVSTQIVLRLKGYEIVKTVAEYISNTDKEDP